MDVKDLVETATDSVIQSEVKSAEINPLLSTLAGGALGGLTGYLTTPKELEQGKKRDKAKALRRALTGTLLGGGAGAAGSKLLSVMSEPTPSEVQALRYSGAGTMDTDSIGTPGVTDSIRDSVRSGISDAISSAKDEAKTYAAEAAPSLMARLLSLGTLARSGHIWRGTEPTTRIGKGLNVLGFPATIFSGALNYLYGDPKPLTSFKDIKPHMYGDWLSRLMYKGHAEDRAAVAKELGVEYTKLPSRFSEPIRLAREALLRRLTLGGGAKPPAQGKFFDVYSPHQAPMTRAELNKRELYNMLSGMSWLPARAKTWLAGKDKYIPEGRIGDVELTKRELGNALKSVLNKMPFTRTRQYAELPKISPTGNKLVDKLVASNEASKAKRHSMSELESRFNQRLEGKGGKPGKPVTDPHALEKLRAEGLSSVGEKGKAMRDKIRSSKLRRVGAAVPTTAAIFANRDLLRSVVEGLTKAYYTDKQ